MIKLLTTSKIPASIPLNKQQKNPIPSLAQWVAGCGRLSAGLCEVDATHGLVLGRQALGLIHARRSLGLGDALQVGEQVDAVEGALAADGQGARQVADGGTPQRAPRAALRPY